MTGDSTVPQPKLVAAFFKKHSTGLVTLVFTDLVDSTALLHQLGDQAGTTFLRQRRQILREVLHSLPEAEEIETAGDSFLLVFAKPSDAVRFALQSQTRLRTFSTQSNLGVQERMGIHLGEVVISEHETEVKAKDLYGIQLAMCARVMSLAKGGQVLMSRGVFDSARQVLKGEDIPGVGGLRWVSHGPYLLKGIEEPVEVCEVAESGEAELAAPKTSEKAQRQVRADEEPVLGWRPAVGQEVPNTKWALEQKLGEGGFGEVWLGRHQTMKERRVFKFCFRADRVRSLKREMTLFRLIKERIGDHPNIVALREVYFEQPPFYIEEDYVAGEDLATWCESQRGVEQVPLEVRLEIVAQIAEALQAAHDAGVIHRDVKPANILICNLRLPICDLKKAAEPRFNDSPEKASGVDTVGSGLQSQIKNQKSKILVKLTDFGIGQVVSKEYLAGVTKAGFTQTMLGSTSSHTGTQMYMAPELLAGKPASIRSDIYSLGVVLYQLIVGDLTRPLTTDWAREIPDPLLREDLQHCIAGKPEERFAGAAQLARHLCALPQRRAELAQQQAEIAARETAAYRRGIVRTMLAAALILVVIALLAIVAINQARLARASAKTEKQERQRAQTQELAARRTAYASDINLIQQALAVDNLGRAKELLNRHKPKPGENLDLRDWEWRYLWQRCRGEPRRLLAQKQSIYCGLSVSADGNWLAMDKGPDGKGIPLWDLNRLQKIKVLEDGKEHGCVTFSPKEPLMAFSTDVGVGSTNHEYVVEFWNTATQKRQHRRLLLDAPCAGLAFAREGRTLATFTEVPEDRITFWNVAQGTPIKTNSVPRGIWGWGGRAIAEDLSVAAFTTGGKDIFDATPVVAVLDLATGKTRWKRKVTDDYVAGLYFSPDGTVLATCGGFEDSSVRFWNAATGEEIGHPAEGHHRYIMQLVFWPDGKRMATASADETIRIWDTSDLRAVRCLGLLRGHQAEVQKLALHFEDDADDTRLISSAKDGTVYVWDISKMAQIDHPAYMTVTNMTDYVFAPDGQSMLILDRPGWVDRRLAPGFDKSEPWMAIDMGLIGGLAEGEWTSFSPDARFLAVRGTNGVVQVWDLEHRTNFCKVATTPGPLMSFQMLHQEGLRLLIALSKRNRVEEWDLPTGRLARSWPCRESVLDCSLNAHWCLSWDASGKATLLDLTTGNATERDWSGFMLEYAAFSPDASLLAVSSGLGPIKLYETTTLREVRALGGLHMRANWLAFAPNGRRLIAGSTGHEAIELWDVESGQQLLTLAGQGCFYKYTTLSPDGTTLGGWPLSQMVQQPYWRGPLHLWRAPSWAEIEAADKAEATLTPQ